MILYIVTCLTHDWDCVIGVYSTLELAQRSVLELIDIDLVYYNNEDDTDNFEEIIKDDSIIYNSDYIIHEKTLDH